MSYGDSGSSTPAWMVRARTPDDDESFAMCPFNGKFQIRATRTHERAMETIARRREADKNVVVMSFVCSMASSRVSAR